MTETLPPWFQRVTDILGLYEFSGESDNPTILAMAKACGGNIAKVYKHDATAWCALTMNYTLISTGFRGNDSLWALDFRKYGVKLSGPAIGAIATKTRDGGGHVFQVVGKTADGKIVGRGGNQDDMVCDETFDPSVLAYNWPAEYSAPKTGMASLPIVRALPHTKRSVTLPPQINARPNATPVAPIQDATKPKPVVVPQAAPSVPPQTPSGAKPAAPKPVEPKTLPDVNSRNTGIGALIMAAIATAVAAAKAHPVAIGLAALGLAAGAYFLIKHFRSKP